FEQTIPALIKAWEATPASDPLKAKLSEQIGMLRGWDLRWSATSVPTSLAVFWGQAIGRVVGADARTAGIAAEDYVAHRATAQQLLEALAAASDQLTADFGTWKTP
ncbi:MAG TPA: acylase, partial [Gemmatimonadales bacterium]|nr:acylase [Gemmatimonadales bacterium]